MLNEFSRSALLLGEDALDKLKNSSVAVFGVGGVGGYTVEALARSGVGEIHLIDNDTVSLTNINRQIIALHSTIGEYKTKAAKARILDINPCARVFTYESFFLAENSHEFDFSKFDYVVDAIDTISGKIEIAICADKAGVPVISSMGAGNKLNPLAFEVCDISQTSVCPLARVMRRELKKRGITHMKTVYSKEPPLTPKLAEGGTQEQTAKRQTPGSVAFVPSVAGLIIAGEVIKDLTMAV